jgi:1,4-alpha-glucan branching enzyme
MHTTPTHTEPPDAVPHLTDAGVRFCFRAPPTVTHVAVAGTFNSWDAQTHPLAQIAPTEWALTVPIAAGRHLYKYVIDDHDWIADPVNPWRSEDGQGNSCFTLTETGQLLVWQGEIDAAQPGVLYRETTAHASPAWLRDAVIYALAVRPFAGTFAGVQARLPELCALGVTAIWLLPIHPIGVTARSGTLGDPYAVRDFLAIDPALGNADDLHALIAAAHVLGLRVILDWTLNRSSIDNPLTAQHPEWFQRDRSGAVIYAVPGRTAFAGFDFRHPDLCAYLIAALTDWVTRFGFDGVRFDDSDLTPLPVLRQIRAALVAVQPEIALISQAYDELHHLGACDLTYEGGVRTQIQQIGAGQLPAAALGAYWAQSTYSFPRGALRMRWIEEKEQDRAFRFFGPGLHRAAASVLLLLDGVPLILMGQEWNEPRWRSWQTLFEPVPLDRDAADQPTLTQYRALLMLRAHHVAFRRGTVRFTDAGADRVVRFWRETAAEQFCVTVNLAAAPRSPLPHADALITWYATPHTDATLLAPFGTLVERRAR